MDSTSGMSIGQRIALYRRLRGLTQEGLAMRLHRSKSWVTKVERGERQIDRSRRSCRCRRRSGSRSRSSPGDPTSPSRVATAPSRPKGFPSSAVS